MSKGTYLVLVKLVLASLPIYLLSSRLIPNTVVFEIEKLIKKFLRGSTYGGQKIHLVSWETLCLPIDWGD